MSSENLIQKRKDKKQTDKVLFFYEVIWLQWKGEEGNRGKEPISFKVNKI